MLSLSEKLQEQVRARSIGPSPRRKPIEISHFRERSDHGQRRLEDSTNLFFEDLCRQDLEGVTIKADYGMDLPVLGPVTIPIYVKRSNGTELFVGLCEPLTRDTPADVVLRDVKQSCPTIPVVLCDEIWCRGTFLPPRITLWRR